MGREGGCVCVGWELCDNHKTSRKVQLGQTPVMGGELPFMWSFRRPIHFYTRKIVMILLSCCVQLTVHCFLLQTRLADWKDGGLSSKFMLTRLKQASLELQQYEESAAPPGWKCVWDR